MSSTTKNLVRLADLLAEHLSVTHWAVSYRITGGGRFFQRLANGGDCNTRTADAVLRRLSEQWPEDLEWPTDIPRPPRTEDAA